MRHNFIAWNCNNRTSFYSGWQTWNRLVTIRTERRSTRYRGGPIQDAFGIDWFCNIHPFSHQ